MVPPSDTLQRGARGSGSLGACSVPWLPSGAEREGNRLKFPGRQTSREEPDIGVDLDLLFQLRLKQRDLSPRGRLVPLCTSVGLNLAGLTPQYCKITFFFCQENRFLANGQPTGAIRCGADTVHHGCAGGETPRRAAHGCQSILIAPTWGSPDFGHSKCAPELPFTVSGSFGLPQLFSNYDPVHCSARARQ